jgi:hypothetical protein
LRPTILSQKGGKKLDVKNFAQLPIKKKLTPVVDFFQTFCSEKLCKKVELLFHDLKRWEIVGQHELRSALSLREIDP